jgi:pyruvate formate lyase activating enzyme
MLGPGEVVGRWHHRLPSGRVQCDLCPRRCRLQDGQRAFCFVRQRQGDDVVLTSYGRASGFCVDPIEKKPLTHFLPGSAVLSFGTAGCNLGCRFCQNWDISKARETDKLSDAAAPTAIAQAASDAGCKSVAFTYNDPVIFAEYAIDTAQACREAGLRSVAVTAGYITPEARPAFFSAMDAVNIDLKAFSEGFYKKLCFAELKPVLETLAYVRRETNVWLEITTLLIPGQNDSEDEVARLCDWVLTELGPDVPLHFTRFHPDYQMTDLPGTPPLTCERARRQAMSAGLRYAYTGNIHDRSGQSTYCPSCSAVVIERDGYSLGKVSIVDGCCGECGASIPGVFDPNGPGDWGARRLPVVLSR